MGVLSKVGEFFSGGAGGLLEKGMDLIDKRIPDKDLAAQLKHDFEVLVETNRQEAERWAFELEKSYEEEVTKRVQAEQASNDTYTQRTRPKIARQSWYAGCGYIAANVLTTLLSPYLQTDVYDITLRTMVKTVGPIVPLDWGILIAVYSPALAYMGVRSFDKWKRS